KPEVILAILRGLSRISVECGLALLWARAEKTPPVRQQIRSELAAAIVADGMVSRAEYEHWLGAAPVVVSTAIHEFQGLSVLEAVSAGAVPVVPDDLCYREQYAAANRYAPGQVEQAAAQIIAALQQYQPVATP